MEFLIIAAFLVALVAVIAAMIMATSASTSKVLRLCYWSWFVVAAGACIFTTFNYTYYANSNTRVHGWPIPIVVFQRDDAESPWLDFVGPTTFLAYPMNLVLFLTAPSVALLAWRRFKRSSDNQKAEQASSSNGG